MSLTVYNTATRKKEAFVPIDPQHIKMYVCGPTVYNLIHIGNARPAVVFDVLFRLLQNEYPRVTYARNITDIDDKIMKAAAESGEPIVELTRRYAAEYQADTDALGTLQPTVVPYATEHIPQMTSIIERLIDGGHAYEAEGHVLFDVRSMQSYGKLSNRSLEDMLEGARVEVAPYKKYAGDFVLWKPSTGDAPGWDSPWGYGRPGWHLECSAMIEAHLGESIDIHGGGRDLIFPHHENEVAQSCCAREGSATQPTDWVHYWMHNGYVNIDGEKMSKSLGNFRTVRELLEHYRGEVIRFALLSAQYRSELDFSRELLEQSRASLDTLYGFLRDHQDVQVDDTADIKGEPVYQALLDDLNTPVAISELYALAKSLGSASSDEKTQIKSVMHKAGYLLGLLQQDPDEWFQQSGSSDQISADEIEALIEERAQAKLDKNYARADEIRAQLEAEGVLLEDSREGTKWKRA
jgi:cysteinyl-tRNA synthetase